MKTLAPALGWIFAEPVEKEQKTESGIFIAASKEQEPMCMAVVINSNVRSFDLEQGSTIIYKPYAAYQIKLNGEKYLLLHRDAYIGTIVEVSGE